MLLSMILLHAIVSKMKARMAQGLDSADYAKDRLKRFKRTHKNRQGLLEAL
jgi:hypothetical protein